MILKIFRKYLLCRDIGHVCEFQDGLFVFFNDADLENRNEN